VPGARVITSDGKLLAWVGRGGQSMITFLPKDEPDASHAGNTLAEALVGIARRRARIAMLMTIDGAPALESPLAKLLAVHGFAARRGALVFIPGRAAADDLGRRGERARSFAEGGGFSAFGREASGYEARTQPVAPATAPGASDDGLDDDAFDDDLMADGELAPDDDLPPDDVEDVHA
jgi:hypothetical protein